MKHLTLACVFSLAACRRGPQPRDASQRPRAVDVAAPTADVATAPRSVALDVRGLTAWAELAPGVRWRHAELRVLSVTPAVERAAPPPDTLQWVVIRVDVARANLNVERAPEDSITALWERDSMAVAMVNAAYFEPDYSASGLVFAGGRTLAPVGPRGGSGILTVEGDRVAIVSIDARDGGTYTPTPAVSLALQCGPRIVEVGGVAGIHRHDGRYAARTVACVRDAGHTLDLIATWDERDPRRGPELHDLATILASPSPTGDGGPCEAALNLDGGPSTAIYAGVPSAPGGARHAPEGPTPWVFVVRPRR